MMVRRTLIVLCVGVITVLLASCGQTYKLQSISITPAAGYNLTDANPQGALTVTASYSNTKSNVVTVNSSYEIQASPLSSTTAPLSVDGVPTVTVNKSGVVTASSTAVACTWVAVNTNGTTTYQSEPYLAQASYTENGVTATASVAINVATSAGCGGQSNTAPAAERGATAVSSRDQ